MDTKKYLQLQVLRNRFLMRGTGYLVGGVITANIGATLGLGCVVMSLMVGIAQGQRDSMFEKHKEKIVTGIYLASYPCIGLGLLGTVFMWRRSYRSFRTAIMHYREMKDLIK